MATVTVTAQAMEVLMAAIDRYFISIRHDFPKTASVLSVNVLMYITLT
jgi:hypothetical protein